MHGHSVCLAITASHRHDELAIAVEAGIQRAIGVQTDQAEVVFAAVRTTPRQENPTIGLPDNASRNVLVATEGNVQLAVLVKAGIQGSIGIQTDHAEITVVTGFGYSRDQEPAIGLQDRRERLFTAVLGDDHLSIDTEARVQRPIWVQSHHAEIVTRDGREVELVIRMAGRNDFLVGLHDHTRDVVVGEHDRCIGLAVGIKA